MNRLSCPICLIVVSVTLTFAASVTSVSQWDITWTFDKAYETGQFINGDWWVVGPVTVTGITKPHGSDGHDGSMINPIPGSGHGYDQQISGYKSDLDVSRALPLALETGASLVSTVTWVPGDEGCPAINSTANAPRPTGRKAAVLTCVATPPEPDAFRPPCVGTWKPTYTRTQVRSDLLPAYATVPLAPALATVERYVERVWLDHNPEWIGAYLIPQENMQHYAREISHEINDAMLRLMIDDGDREILMIRLIQVGIDLYGSLKAGQYWGTWGGGWGHGRKMPILLAGMLLDVDEMKDIGKTYEENKFQEDCQTFYISQTDIDRFPSLFTTLGVPEWGSRHCNRPDTDDLSRGYKVCCTSYTWPGAALVAMMMNDANGVNGRTLWNWEAFFDYVDLWVEDGGYNTGTFISNFQMGAWQRYRDLLPAEVSVKDIIRSPNVQAMSVTAEPNPMMDHIIITVDTETSSLPCVASAERGWDVSVSGLIYDQSGNIVNTVSGAGHDPSVGSGQRLSLRWNGNMTSGSLAKPGMYFYRITAGNNTVSGRIIKTR